MLFKVFQKKYCYLHITFHHCYHHQHHHHFYFPSPFLIHLVLFSSLVCKSSSLCLNYCCRQWQWRREDRKDTLDIRSLLSIKVCWGSRSFSNPSLINIMLDSLLRMHHRVEWSYHQMHHFQCTTERRLVGQSEPPWSKPLRRVMNAKLYSRYRPECCLCTKTTLCGIYTYRVHMLTNKFYIQTRVYGICVYNCQKSVKSPRNFIRRIWIN